MASIQQITDHVERQYDKLPPSDKNKVMSSAQVAHPWIEKVALAVVGGVASGLTSAHVREIYEVLKKRKL